MSSPTISMRRVHIFKAHCGRGVTVRFPIEGQWYEVGHDDLVRIIGETTPFLESRSWREGGAYSTPHPSRRLRDALACYRIGVQ